MAEYVVSVWNFLFLQLENIFYDTIGKNNISKSNEIKMELLSKMNKSTKIILIIIVIVILVVLFKFILMPDSAFTCSIKGKSWVVTSTGETKCLDKLPDGIEY